MTGAADERDDAEREVAAWIRVAGARPAMPSDARERVRRAVLASRERARRRRSLAGLALAATVAGIVVGTGLLWWRATPPAAVATVERSVGRVETTEDGAWRPLGAQAVGGGARLRTAHDGGLALRLNGGIALRVATDTVVIVRDASSIELERGRVYVDTHTSGRTRRLLVVAGGHRIVNDGTQFEVLDDRGSQRVRVRSGRVGIDAAGARIVVPAGREVVFDGAVPARWGVVSPRSEEWRWAESLARVPGADARSLADVAAWIARETARDIRFADAVAAERARTTIVHGELGGIPPGELLEAVLVTTAFEVVAADEATTVIGLRRTAGAAR